MSIDTFESIVNKIPVGENVCIQFQSSTLNTFAYLYRKINNNSLFPLFLVELESGKIVVIKRMVEAHTLLLDDIHTEKIIKVVSEKRSKVRIKI